MKRVISLVTARGGSKGIKNKNLLPIGGLTLASKACNDAINATCVNDVYICTDSQEILNNCAAVGALSIGLRPKAFAIDSSTDNEVLVSFCRRYWDLYGSLPEIIIHLRPTSPQRNSALIDEVYSAFYDIFDDCTSMRTYHCVSGEALKLAKIDSQGFLDPLSSPETGTEIWGRPRQHLQFLAKGNGLVDILKVENILSCTSHYGLKVKGYETPPSIDIDTINDYNIVLQNPSIFH